MTYHGTANGGLHAPTTQRGTHAEPCCAKCRRGTKAHGFLACGYDLYCPKGCHAGVGD